MDNTTRKLLKILHLTPDQVYHVFCLGLCLVCSDGKVTDREAEMLTRIGFGLGLSPQDIQSLLENAKSAVKETSVADVVAYSVASLKKSLDAERLEGVRQILEFIATSDRHLSAAERNLLQVISETWTSPGEKDSLLPENKN
ncbi:MAG: TerB family tellurite resistance protein [Candidatus Sumerlaeaceae bacterium]